VTIPRGPTAILLLKLGSKFLDSNLHGFANFHFELENVTDRIPWFKFKYPHQGTGDIGKKLKMASTWKLFLPR
jgi:hypothetical protein